MDNREFDDNLVNDDSTSDSSQTSSTRSTSTSSSYGVVTLKQSELANSKLQTAILSLDIGTTNLKCSLYDENLKIIFSNSSKLNVLTPRKDFSELDPAELYDLIKKSINNCIANCPDDYIIRCFGISTQRNSITLWNNYYIHRKTEERYSNFILWNDKRATEICNSLNRSVYMFGIRKFSQVYSSIISSHHYNAISKYKIDTTHVTPRLIGQLRSLENRLETQEYENILYGTIDTWLIYNITEDKTFATDISCACSTGFYDLFLDKWSKILCYIFSVPDQILPDVFDSCYNYGKIKPKLFDFKTEVPLTTSIGDVQSSFIAECAFTKGDIVITAGTGAFISVNVGNKPASSNNSNYPLIAYRYKSNKAYMLHSPVSSPGIAIEWAKLIGLFESFDDIEAILQSTESSNGVTFFPGFGLLTLKDLESENSKSKNASQTASFHGIKSNTTKPDMLRAIFDSIAYSIKIKFDSLQRDMTDLNISTNSIKIAGGVARSDFLCQLLCNLFNHPIERNIDCHTSSSKGAAFLAGLSAGFWSNLSDLKKYRNNIKIFKPKFTKTKRLQDYRDSLEEWKRNVVNSL